MALYAISDLHLSFTDDKPMDVFGEVWVNHDERIRANWLAKIRDEIIHSKRSNARKKEGSIRCLPLCMDRLGW